MPKNKLIMGEENENEQVILFIDNDLYIINRLFVSGPTEGEGASSGYG